ncbi:MAG: hypothetical protein RMI91_05420 [Gemmatales bacterium]|nr:hypothetical protein [Gemmatales bacterium]MDW7994075.1 hypothetical protein [Gemmatales bacterium]
MNGRRSRKMLAALGVTSIALITLVAGTLLIRQALEQPRLPESAEITSSELPDSGATDKLSTNDSGTGETSSAALSSSEEWKLPTASTTAVLGDDITARVQEINSPKYAEPPKRFRSGHVQRKTLDPSMVTRTKNGFLIKFPSRAPIPTPTVYQGKLYVSGGFRSREYYCFDA